MGFLSSVFGFNGPNADEQAAKRRATSATSQYGQDYGRINNAFMGGMEGFDPYSAMRDSSMGMLNMFLPRLKESVAGFREGSVDAGRFDTGFAQQGEDRLIRGGFENMNNQILSNALQANQQRLGQLGTMGSYAGNMGNTFMDATIGDYQTQQAQRLADNASKRSMWGSMIGGAMNVMPWGKAGSAIKGVFS